jgi:hypothetical protein
MKKIKAVVSIVAISLICAALIVPTLSANPHQNKMDDKTKAMGKGFAVVELFTSEGCSSCPAADAAVARVQKKDDGLPVYILAFHVDYWNRLGWRDVFSDAAYSKRQSQYAGWLNLSSVYTPQVVVNGKKEFVGSQENTLDNTIKDNLQKPASAVLTLNNVQITQQKATVDYTAKNVIEDLSLVLAVVQKSAVTKVERGENGGRTLPHVQIVRSLQMVDLKKGSGGKAQVDVPTGLDFQNLEVIGFLQNNTTGEIVAATKTRLQ